MSAHTDVRAGRPGRGQRRDRKYSAWSSGADTLVCLNEPLQRQLAPLNGAPLPQVTRDVLRNVADPSLGDIEPDHADGTVVLPLQQTADNRHEVGVLDIGLAPGG